MTIQFSRYGRDAEVRASLPFNNALVMRVQVNPLAEDVAQAFEINRNTHLWLLFQAAALVENQGAAGRQMHDLIKPWQGKVNDDFHDGLCRVCGMPTKKRPITTPIPM